MFESEKKNQNVTVSQYKSYGWKVTQNLEIMLYFDGNYNFWSIDKYNIIRCEIRRDFTSSNSTGFVQYIIL